MNLEELLIWVTMRGLLIWSYLGTPGADGAMVTYVAWGKTVPPLIWRTLGEPKIMTAVALDIHLEQGTITLTSNPHRIPGTHDLELFGAYFELKRSVESMEPVFTLIRLLGALHAPAG